MTRSWGLPPEASCQKFDRTENVMKKEIAFAALALCGMTITTTARADRLIAGAVNPNGTPQNINGPTNQLYTITHSTTGTYRITFAPNVFGGRIPACIVTPIGLVAVSGLHENVSYCEINFINFNAIANDTYFSFFATTNSANPPP